VTQLELRHSISGGWEVQAADVIENWEAESGLVQFSGVLGNYRVQARLTYSGGYWYDTTVAGTGELPAGATLLPAAIKEAWYLQCGQAWLTIDKLGLAHTEALAGQGGFLNTRLSTLDLLPQVKAMIAAHRRMSLT
jgi:hypothetical protein